MKKLKYIYCLLVLIGFSSITQAQYTAKQLQSRAQFQAQQMMDSLVKGRHTGYVAFIYPKLAQMAGGKESMVTGLDKVRENMVKKGEQFVRIKAGKAGTCVKEKNELQCVLQQTTTVKTLQGEKNLRTHIICISVDNGKRWTFIDTGGAKPEMIRQAFPNVSASLVFPPLN